MKKIKLWFFIIFILSINNSFSKEIKTKKDFKNIKNMYGIWQVKAVKYNIISPELCSNKEPYKTLCLKKIEDLKNKNGGENIEKLKKEIGKKILIEKYYYEYDYQDNDFKNYKKFSKSNGELKNSYDFYKTKNDLIKYYKIQNPRYTYIDYDNDDTNVMSHNVPYTSEMVDRKSTLLNIEYFTELSEDVPEYDGFDVGGKIQFILDSDKKRQIGISNYDGRDVIEWILILEKVK